VSDTISRQTAWRKENPEKAIAQQDRSTSSRKERVESDPEYAEKLRAESRAAHAEKARKIREGGPDGWRVIVRLQGEKRGRPLLDIVYTDSGKIRGLKRKQAVTDVPKAWTTRAEAEEVAQALLQSFPKKIEQAYPAVA
jgi:hypothetical protein